MFLEWENNGGKLQIIGGKFQNSGKFQNNAIKAYTYNAYPTLEAGFVFLDISKVFD